MKFCFVKLENGELRGPMTESEAVAFCTGYSAGKIINCSLDRTSLQQACSLSCEVSLVVQREVLPNQLQQ